MSTECRESYTRTDIQPGDYSRCCCSEAVRLSVCLSVRPSDSSIVSERMHVIVKLSTALVFVSATTVTKFSGSPLPAPTRTVWPTATKFGIVVYVGDERISKGSITPIKLWGAGLHRSKKFWDLLHARSLLLWPTSSRLFRRLVDDILLDIYSVGYPVVPWLTIADV